MTLGDPQPAARDQVLGDVGPILSNPQRVTSLCQFGCGRESPAFDMHDDRYRDELQDHEMRFLNEYQSRLGFGLCVVERTLRERDRSALPVDDPLSGRVALSAGAFQRDLK